MKSLNVVVFVLLSIVAVVVALVVHGATRSEPAAAGTAVAGIFLAGLIAAAFKVANEWERMVILRLGNLIGVKGPGMRIVIPVIDRAIFVDTRILTIDIPQQQVITRDNVPVSINGVVYFRVMRPDEAITKVQNYTYAMNLYAQATLRDVIGGVSLDQLLAERQRISDDIEAIVGSEAAKWGLQVENIKVQDIDMPEDLKKMMSRQASAEREKRATITKAEGDRDAALNLAAAATTMATSPGAMQLRTLQTIDGLGPTASNTVVIGIPMEIMEALRGLGKPRDAAA